MTIRALTFLRVLVRIECYRLTRLMGRGLAIALLCACVALVAGHGRLHQPPGRSTMWRHGFNTPRNYNDNELFCGGFGVS